MIIPFARYERRLTAAQTEGECRRAAVETEAVHALPSLVAIGQSIRAHKDLIATRYKAQMVEMTSALAVPDRINTTYAILVFIAESVKYSLTLLSV